MAFESLIHTCEADAEVIEVSMCSLYFLLQLLLHLIHKCESCIQLSCPTGFKAKRKSQTKKKDGHHPIDLKYTSMYNIDEIFEEF